MIIECVCDGIKQIARLEELPGPRFRLTTITPTIFAGSWVESDGIRLSVGQPLVYLGRFLKSRPGRAIRDHGPGERQSAGIVTRLDAVDRS